MEQKTMGNEICETCGGSGQIGMFRGVSRFVISWEECPDCIGTGLLDSDKLQENNPPQKVDNKDKK